MSVKQSGFTLLELMIAVVVVGIIASIAYPSYTGYIERGYRSEGQAFLLDIAARQERFYAQNNSYASSMQNLGLAAESSTGKYKVAAGGISVGQSNTGGYLLKVTPTFNDKVCGVLTLNGLGTRGVEGDKNGAKTKECWR